ncbi:reverse transcriptase zinc-binding domain-containing protein [Tanacetum coccineum]
MKTECGHFGTLVNVIIPSPNPNGNQVSGVGKGRHSKDKESTFGSANQYEMLISDISLVIRRKKDGSLTEFSVRQTYYDLHNVNEVVIWNKLIWFSQNIPKHAFILWLAIQERLTTQDKVRKWGSYDLMMCPLCSNDMDSHNHLFFECEFSNKLWNMVKRRIEYHSSGQNWQDIITELSTLQNGNTIGSIIRRLCFAACVYLIWQERNNRIFKNEKRSNESLFIILNDTIKWRLSSLKFKSSQAVLKAAEI